MGNHKDNLRSRSEAQLPWSKHVVGVQEISSFLGRSEKYVFSLVNSPDFPTPITIGQRNRRWFLGDVFDYLERPVVPEGLEKESIVSIMDYKPLTTEFRPRRVG